MTSWILRGMAAAGVAAAVATGAYAQQQTTASGQKDDWSYFQASNPKECWAVTSPKSTVNTRDGKPASVSRGDIRLFVTTRQSGKPEVSFTGGYPFAPGSTVALEVGSNKFDLLTDGEWAWPASPEEDAKVVTALRGGSQAVLSARSARGTATKDTFSLKGVTAALNEAQRLCQ